MLMLFGWMALIPAARAGEIVLYDGADPEAARAEVARRRPDGHLDPDTEALTYAALAAGAPPVALGAVAVRSCPQAAVAPDLVATVRDAESLIKNSEWALAQAQLSAAAQALPCLNAPVDATALRRLHLLGGYVAFVTHQTTEADDAFRAWLAIDPTAASNTGSGIPDASSHKSST